MRQPNTPTPPDHASQVTLPPEVANHAQAATGVPMVTLTAYDARSGEVSTVRSATGASAATTRTFQAIVRLLPGFSPEGVRLTHRTNTHQAAIYIEGKVTEAPFREMSRDAVPGFVIEITERFIGVKHSMACPITVNGQVRGALVFHTSARPNDAQRRAFQATTAHTSLTLAALEEKRLAERELEQIHEAGASFAQLETESRRESVRLLQEQVRTPLLLAEVSLRTAAETAGVDPVAASRAISEAQARLATIRDEALAAVEEQVYPQVVEMRADAIIRLHADRASRFADVSVDIDHSATPALLDRVSPPSRLALHRTLQMALENVEQHAGASQVRIRLEATKPDELTVLVQDNGSGFDPASTPWRKGLMSIAACVGMRGGTWSLYSSLGSGTTLTASVPAR
jgi:tRNA U34 5-methylaminomethyl-2-thiouridine-forming methyltransferase MnmC